MRKTKSQNTLRTTSTIYLRSCGLNLSAAGAHKKGNALLPATREKRAWDERPPQLAASALAASALGTHRSLNDRTPEWLAACPKWDQNWRQRRPAAVASQS